MAIQQRRGAKADFDATKMLPGELAVTTDGSRKVYVAFAPGDTKELASAEEVEEIIQDGIEEIEQKKEESLAQFPSYEDKLKELETYKANSIISTSSGTVFHESDCAAVPPINIKLFGKGKQNMVPGNQLFDASQIATNISDECSIINNGDGTITVEGSGTLTNNFQSTYISYDMNTKLKVGNLYLNNEANTTPVFHVYGVNSSEERLFTLRHGNYVEITQEILDNLYKVVFTLYGSNGAEIIAGTVKPMLYQDGDGTWEPYVGGEKSPNVRYPQKAEFLGESGNIGGKVCNSQLLKTFASKTETKNGVTCTIDESGNISLSGTSIGYTSFRLGIIDYLQAMEYYCNAWDVNSNVFFQTIGEFDIGNASSINSNKTFKIPESSENATLYLVILNANINCDGLKPKLMISVEPVNIFEPYTEQPFTALTPNGLRGIPLGQTIPDAIKNSPIHMSGVYWDSVEGQYYIADTKNENGKDAQRVNTVDLSTLTWEKNEKWWQTTIDNLVYVSKNTELGLAMCTTYHIRACHGFSTASGSEFGVDTSNIKFARNESEETPVGELTYVLAEPIITESTDQYDVVMNYPNTTIVNDAGAYMEVTHVKDTQKHIEQNYVSKEAYNEHENRIAELEKAIVNS